MVKRSSKGGASQKSVDEIEAKLDDAAHGLAALKTLIDDLEAKLDHASHGLAALKALIDAVEGKLDDPVHGLANLKVLIDALEAKLDNATYGLSALRALIVAVGAAVTAVGGLLTDGTFGLAALNADLDLLLSRLGVPVAASISADIAAVEAKLDNGTYGLAALNTDLDKLLTGIIQGSGTVLPANKSLYDILWVDRSDDESDSFTWDTSAYTTVEQDISALFSTALTGTTRRNYTLYLDLYNVEQDGSFDECYIRVYVKIDGSNWRCIDKATKTDADLQDEPGVPIEIPMVAQDVKVTLQMNTALSGDVTIYYHWVRDKREY